MALWTANLKVMKCFFAAVMHPLHLPYFTFSGKENLIQYLTHLAFNVTAWHEIVGTLTQYVTPPKGFGFSLRPGQTVVDVQSFVQVHSGS